MENRRGKTVATARIGVWRKPRKDIVPFPPLNVNILRNSFLLRIVLNIHRWIMPAPPLSGRVYFLLTYRVFPGQRPLADGSFLPIAVLFRSSFFRNADNIRLPSGCSFRRRGISCSTGCGKNTANTSAKRKSIPAQCMPLSAHHLAVTAV